MLMKISRYSLMLLIMLIVSCSVISTVFAKNVLQDDNSSPEFYISSEKVLSGDEIAVEVAIKNNPGITAFQLKIEYDERYLSLTDVEHCNLFDNLSTCSQTYNSPFKLSWFSQKSLDETCNGIVAVLTFSVNDTMSEGNTEIAISYEQDNVFNSSFENISFKTTKGNISILEYLSGDVNEDKIVNMKDIALFQQYLNDFDVDFNSKAADVYLDNVLNMKDIVLLQKYLNGNDVILGEEQEKEHLEVNYTTFTYGKSELGRDLTCYAFTPTSYTDTVLLNFAIHGYEDEYVADGQILVDTANDLIDYYNNNSDKIGNTQLLIVPCANPDGLYDGYTNNGFGRCNAKGIDLNRDFDANYITRSDSRYYTPYAFSASESRALRDLVNDYSADIVIDFHGWLDYTIGDYELAQVFYEELGLAHYKEFTNSNASGYFSNWAHQQGALGLLVEFTNSKSVNLNNLISATNRILNNDYVVLDKKTEFEKFDTIDCYTLSSDKVNTYQFVDVPYSSPSYIDGATDKVTILDVFDNDWVRVEYPIYDGSMKTAYCYLADFIQTDNILDKFYNINISENMDVYRRSDLNETIGTVYSTDEVIVVSEKDDILQIIYPLDSGGYKMGWINNIK